LEDNNAVLLTRQFLVRSIALIMVAALSMKSSICKQASGVRCWKQFRGTSHTGIERRVSQKHEL